MLSLSFRPRRVLAIGEPLEIEARERQPITGEAALRTAAIEAEDGACVRHGNVAIGAPALFDSLVYRPRGAFVIGHLHADILTVAILARLRLAVRLFEIVGVGKEDAVLAAGLLK